MKFSETFPKGCYDKETLKGCFKDLWSVYDKPTTDPVQEKLTNA